MKVFQGVLQMFSLVLTLLCAVYLPSILTDRLQIFVSHSVSTGVWHNE